MVGRGICVLQICTYFYIISNTSSCFREDLSKFRYLPCFIKEVMRLYTPVPIVTREASECQRINGVDIPAGTYLNIMLYHVHHHPDVYEDPWSFRPERFLDTDDKDPYSFIPFAAGPRFVPDSLYIANSTLYMCSFYMPCIYRLGAYCFCGVCVCLSVCLFVWLSFVNLALTFSVERDRDFIFCMHTQLSLMKPSEWHIQRWT